MKGRVIVVHFFFSKFPHSRQATEACFFIYLQSFKGLNPQSQESLIVVIAREVDGSSHGGYSQLLNTASIVESEERVMLLC